MKKNRRRIIVDPKLQYTITTTLLVVFMLAAGTFYVIMIFALLEVHAAIETLQLAEELPISSELQRIETSAMLAFAGTFIGFVILVVCGGLLLARKIAGPIFAVRRHLDRVADGKTVADLRFRKGDYFSELQAAFNRHMDAYRKRLPPNSST
jgi:nitrogen fixation/metabolism regulation signal transduction histidine kinase